MLQSAAMLMSTFPMARIDALAKREGISFREAAARCGRKGARRRVAKARDGLRLTAAKTAWWWKKDFE